MGNDRKEDTPRQNEAANRTTLLVGLVVIAGAVGWFQWRALASTTDTYETAVRQLDQMRADAVQIQALRQAPKTASGRARTSQELLAQVERALADAGVDRQKWHDSVPRPAVGLPNSDYKRMTTRLYFEDLTLRQLAAFVHHLHSGDPTLQVTGVDLTNRNRKSNEFDIDLGVSYLVYAPREKRQP